jgi:transposase
MTRLPPLEHVDFNLDDLHQRLAASTMSDDDKKAFRAVLDTLAILTKELESSRASISRMRRLVFGAKTEKMSKLFSRDASSSTAAPPSSTEDSPNSNPPPPANSDASPPKRKGHGRNGAAKYTGATQRNVSHPTLTHGCLCPSCAQGKVYRMSPIRLVRLHGAAPISASCTNIERYRCGLCNEVFSAEAPDDIGDDKYDEATMAIVALLKYGTGVPFHRLSRLQLSAGVPLPPSTQWHICTITAAAIAPVFQELVRLAAQGRLIHVDDTGAKILGPVRQPGALPPSASINEGLSLLGPAPRPEDRTGTFTTGVVSYFHDHPIVLYLTGWRHAGDNLGLLLGQRAPDADLPIQMCDALSRNTSGDFQTILANCLAHARREFVDILSRFDEPCRHVIKQLGTVFHNDSLARERHLSPDERLAWHQEHSGPVMQDLAQWMKTEVAERRIEPNSPLGSAIKYMERHWEKLTLFLRVAGAPLSNNLCERILKRAILNRKNSYFFRTQNGASVADVCMTLIQTAEMSHKNPFHYLTTLLKHREQVAASPEHWLPWNYEQTLAELRDVAA